MHAVSLAFPAEGPRRGLVAEGAISEPQQLFQLAQGGEAQIFVLEIKLLL